MLLPIILVKQINYILLSIGLPLKTYKLHENLYFRKVDQKYSEQQSKWGRLLNVDQNDPESQQQPASGEMEQNPIEQWYKMQSKKAMNVREKIQNYLL